MRRPLASRLRPCALAMGVLLLAYSLLALRRSLFTSASRPSRSTEAAAYWATELAANDAAQTELALRFEERQARRLSALARADSRALWRNDRSLNSGTPVVLNWPAPPYFWARYFGKGKGERIDVEGCAVACRLVSGPLNGSMQANAHVFIEYNTWRGHIEGLPEKGPRSLARYQKTALHSLEPNSALVEHSDQLKVRPEARCHHICTLLGRFR